MNKLVKGILVTIGSLVALYLILCLIAPSEVTVSRQQDIQASADSVYAQVASPRNWEKWDPWSEKDPEMKKEFTDVQAGKGAGWCWESDDENVGKGCLDIVDAVPGKEISTELKFEDMNPSQGKWEFVEKDGVTTVTWSMTTSLPFVIRPMGWMFDSWMGPDFEKGLNNLKAICE